MPEFPSKVTLADIAKAADVSVPTVSKVLNGRDDVADATRRRVQRAVRDLRYESPQQKRTKSSGPALVDLVIDRLTSAYSVEVMRGIIDLAATEQVEIVISTINSRQARDADAQQWADRLSATGRRGLILVTSEVDANLFSSFKHHGISVVLVDPLGTPSNLVATVGATNWAGGKAAVEHLIGLGHRRIAYLGGPERAECNQARLHGYVAALMDAGIDVDTALIRSGDFRTDSGVQEFAALLDSGQRPSAVFAGSDTIALGVMAEAHRRGIRIPHDLSIVGFDGTQLTEQSVPRLTSVAQPLHEIGRAALRTVLRLSRGEHPEVPHVELATQLVVRDSTSAYIEASAPQAENSPAAAR